MRERQHSTKSLANQSKPGKRDTHAVQSEDSRIKSTASVETGEDSDVTNYANYGFRTRASTSIPGFHSKYITAGARVADFASKYYDATVVQFIGASLGAAFGILFACMEDIVWLLAFNLRSDNYQTGMIYVSSTACIWFMAFFIFLCVRWFAAEEPNLPITEIIETGTAAVMVILTCSLFREWYKHLKNDERETDQAVNDPSDMVATMVPRREKSPEPFRGAEGGLEHKAKLESNQTPKNRCEAAGSVVNLLFICFATSCWSC